MQQSFIQDEFGRSFRYLRVSVTDACNFSCHYCLPHGYCKDANAAPPLNHNEFQNLVVGFAVMGVTKIRLTGGEPTLRRDIVELVRLAKQTPGIQTVALSTNGFRLTSLITPLQEAGLDAVNVSLDSLNPKKFESITGSQLLNKIRDGIDASIEHGLRVKINAVLMKDVNDQELPDFLAYIKNRPVSVRFIELMQTGDNQNLFKTCHIPAEDLEKSLRETGWQLEARGPTAGPAREYFHPEYAGKIGVIAPYGHDFCGNCNRLRISCRGELKLCLFGDGQHSIRAFIQDPAQKEELQAAVLHLLKLKKISHFLHEGNYGDTRKFSSIGG